MAFELRPLTLAELLDRSFSTYKHHLWLFAGIMAAPASVGLLYAMVMQVLQFTVLAPDPAPSGRPTPEQAALVMAPVAIGAILFLVVYMVLYAFALGATTIAVAHLYRDRMVTVAAAYREVRRHVPRLVLTMLLAAVRIAAVWFGLMTAAFLVGIALAFIAPILTPVVVVIGFVVSVVPAFYMGIRYGMAVPAVVLEDLGPARALARSVELTEGHRGRVFLLILCAMVITYAAALLLQGPFMMAAVVAGPESVTAFVLMLFGAVLGSLGGMFSGPIMIIGLAMLYYDLRIRKEALDLQMMLEALDAPHT